MAAVLAASSLYGLYAAESEEIVAQVFGDRREHKEAFFYPHEKQKSISPVSASSTIPVRSYISNYMVFHDLYFGNLAW